MTLKIAILGTGRIAENSLAPALVEAADGEFWSVLSRNLKRAERFSKQFNAQSPTPAYDTLSDLMADPSLDAVIIATPDGVHTEQTLAAAIAGKHVFCEKPLATNREDAQSMVDACKTAKVQLGLAYHMRWHTGHRRLFGACQAGDFGDLRHMRLQWSSYARDNSNWRAHDEVGRWWSLGGVGTHLIDQMRWFLCPVAGEVVDMSSTISRSHFGGPHDETAILGFRFESGATAEICSSVMFEGPRRMEVYGTRNYAICENTLGLSGTGSIWTKNGRFNFEPKNPYVGEIEDFIKAIIDQRLPEVNGEEGQRNVELLLQAIE